MKRNSISEAIVLKTSPFGEIHKNVTMFTREEGLIRAIAYGALKGKGKLRNLTSPFTYGTSYLYNEPVKGSYKITDIDVKSFFENLRHDLKKFYAASLWAEIVLLSHGGGESSPELFDLLLEALEYLDSADDERDPLYASIQFIWHYLSILGLQPENSFCADCGRSIEGKQTVYYSQKEEGFLCDLCRDEKSVAISAGSRRYLEYSADQPFQQAVKIRLSQDSANSVKNLMFRLAETVVEHQLNTLKTGEGIL